MTSPLCFLDTETDGVHPDRQVWEIACIRREPDGREHTWQGFLQIGTLADSDPFGLRVGGFFDRHPRGRRLSGQKQLKEDDFIWSHEEAADVVFKMTHGAHIVGAVPNFDTEVLEKLLRSHGMLPTWHYHLIDVENLAVGWLAASGNLFRPPWDSDAITAALGIPQAPAAERHTALGDARWARRIYDAVMASQSANAVAE